MLSIPLLPHSIEHFRLLQLLHFLLERFQFPSTFFRWHLGRRVEKHYKETIEKMITAQLALESKILTTVGCIFQSGIAGPHTQMLVQK